MKRTIVALLLVLTLLASAGCGLRDPVTAKEKVFSSEGMKITLTEGFQETNIQGYTVCYDSSKIAVFALREAFTLLEGLENSPVEDYAQIVLEANKSRGADKVETVEGIPCIEYSYHNDSENKDYSYFTATFKASDAFWLVQFVCETANYEELRPTFIHWAKTVSFS